MINDRFTSKGVIATRPDRIRTRKGSLSIDIPAELFEASLAAFTKAAEDFILKLTEPLHRRFAYRYLIYLQEVARLVQQSRPNTFRGRGQPAYRLICNELEQLFRQYFSSSTEEKAGQSIV